jgi:hypothetical protein
MKPQVCKFACYMWEATDDFTAERASLAVPKKATGRVLDGRADRNGAGA